MATAKQLDADIDEALQESSRERERNELTEYINTLDQRGQELVIRVQETAALGDILKAAGLHTKHRRGRGKFGEILVWGKPTYQLRDVLKKYGFRFDGRTKQWIRPTDYSVRPGDIDYLAFYNDLVKKL